MTAAVVNEDTGTTVATADGTQRLTLGADLAEELTAGTEPATFAWVATDADAAADGLADGTYGAVLTIPSDFSADDRLDHRRRGRRDEGDARAPDERRDELRARDDRPGGERRDRVVHGADGDGQLRRPGPRPPSNGTHDDVAGAADRADGVASAYDRPRRRRRRDVHRRRRGRDRPREARRRRVGGRRRRGQRSPTGVRASPRGRTRSPTAPASLADGASAAADGAGSLADGVPDAGRRPGHARRADGRPAGPGGRARRRRRRRGARAGRRRPGAPAALADAAGASSRRRQTASVDAAQRRRPLATGGRQHRRHRARRPGWHVHERVVAALATDCAALRGRASTSAPSSRPLPSTGAPRRSSQLAAGAGGQRMPPRGGRSRPPVARADTRDPRPA